MSGQFPDSTYFAKQVTVGAKLFMKSVSDAIGALKVNKCIHNWDAWSDSAPKGFAVRLGPTPTSTRSGEDFNIDFIH